MKSKFSNKVRRVWQRVAGSLWRDLPPGFGDPVPPEVRVFENETAEIQHRVAGSVAAPKLPQTNPTHPNGRK